MRGLRQAAAVIAVIALSTSSAAAKAPDLAKLDELRSLIAEAVLVEQAASAGRVTETYARTLRQEFRQGVQKLVRSPGLGDAARAGLRAIDTRDSAALAALRDRLVAAERSHGRAG